jgi:hypothetical protein
MTKARDLADLGNKTSLDEINDAYNAGALSNRNVIINGAMQVAQRGTSFTSNGYTMDRFRVANGSVGNITTTQESTNSPSGVSKYSMKVTATNTASLASSSDGWIRYVIETKDIENLTLSDTTKHFTVSFYVKCSDTGQSSIGVTSGNFSSAQYVSPFTIANADTWQRVSVAIPCSSLLSNVNGDYGLRLYWDIGAGTNYQTSSTNQWVTGGTYASSGNLQITGVNGRYLQITGVQLEVGGTATPFERRSYGDELLACKRYFQRIAGGESGITTSVIMTGVMHNNTFMEGVYKMEVEMRTKPTIERVSGTNYYGFSRNGAQDQFNSISIDSAASNPRQVNLYNATEVSGTAGQGGIVFSKVEAAIVSLSAEL